MIKLSATKRVILNMTRFALILFSLATVVAAHASGPVLPHDVQQKLHSAYDFVGEPSEGFVVVGNGGKYGYADLSGRIVVALSYEGAMPLTDGLAPVCIDGRWGFIEPDGFPAITCRYQQVRPFSEGRSAVQLDGKWGFIDHDGFPKIPCRYDNVSDFSNGCATVTFEGKQQTIDPDGQIVK